MPDVQLPHARLYYVQITPDQQRCPPVILIHGAGGTHLDWPPQIRRLPSTQTVAPDLAGHGKSEGEGYTQLLPHARDVVGLADTLGLQRTVLVGHSMGGAIAQLIALNWPERVAGLVLIATGSKLPIDPVLVERVVTDPAGAVDWMMEMAWGPRDHQELRQLGRLRLIATSPAALQRDFRACQEFDTRALLAQIGAPTLVIAGADDRLVPPKFSRTLVEGLPRATLVELPHAGHMSPLEQPEAVTAALLSWLMEQTW